MTREEKIYELRGFCNMQDGCDKCDLDELSINCAFSKMDDEKINELYYKIRSGEDITKEHSKTIAEITGAAKERNEEEKTCLVVQCENCGRIHVYFRKWRDGESCSQCGGGPFRMLGVPTVRGNKEKLVKIRVSVEREELDRLMKDLDNVNKLANETYDKIRELSKIKIEC